MSPDLAALAARLAADPYWGWTVLDDPAWRKAWDAAPRNLFVPDTWFTWDGYRYVRHDRGTGLEAWCAAVETDHQIITQITDGIPSCSNSMPSLVAAMLDGLDVADGTTVLESGTGTGWTAALLSARLGSGNVVSVEFDPVLADAARAHAETAGFTPLIAAGDGTAGHAARAPYDRVSATHAVRQVPAAWIEQTRPGGLVCAPLTVGAGLDVFVRLEVDESGGAEGRLLFPVQFMGDRAARAVPEMPAAEGPERTSTTSLDVPALIESKHLWVLQLAVPGLTVTGPRVEDGDDCMWFSTPDGSWAVAYVPTGAPWDGAVVEQHGPADVWTAAEAAWASWKASGRPGLDEYGLSVLPGGKHRLWLGGSGNVVSVLP